MELATTLTPNLFHKYYSKFGAVWGCAVWGVNGENMSTMDAALRGPMLRVWGVEISYILRTFVLSLKRRS